MCDAKDVRTRENAQLSDRPFISFSYSIHLAHSWHGETLVLSVHAERGDWHARSLSRDLFLVTWLLIAVQILVFSSMAAPVGAQLSVAQC